MAQSSGERRKRASSALEARLSSTRAHLCSSGVPPSAATTSKTWPETKKMLVTKGRGMQGNWVKRTKSQLATRPHALSKQKKNQRS
jgi:hypothetical protein